MADETLHMTIWNCHSSLRTDAEYFEDTFKNTIITMYKETHQCVASKLIIKDYNRAVRTRTHRGVTIDSTIALGHAHRIGPHRP